MGPSASVEMYTYLYPTGKSLLSTVNNQWSYGNLENRVGRLTIGGGVGMLAIGRWGRLAIRGGGSRLVIRGREGSLTIGEGRGRLAI